MRGKVRPVSIRKNQEVSASKPKKQSFSAPKGTKETPKPNMGRKVQTARPNTDRKEQGPVKKFHTAHTFHKDQPTKSFVNRRPKIATVEQAAPAPEGVIGGRNAVTELLRTGRSINKLYLQEGIQGGSIGNILRLAKQAGVALEYVKQEKLNTMLPGIKHQGVIAVASPVAFSSLESVVAKARSRGEEPFLLLLDELQDPQNVGALLRTADAAGVHGVLLPSRNSCPLNAVVAKISAGAVEYVPVVQIGNITQTLQELKKQGFWVVGADMAGSICYDTDLTGPLVVVIGAEGKGLGRLVRDNCDILVQLPMFGNINSLNASAAGAVLMYEVVRQRLARAKHNG